MLKQMYIDLVKRPNPLIIRWMRKAGSKRCGTVPWKWALFYAIILSCLLMASVLKLLHFERQLNQQSLFFYQQLLASLPRLDVPPIPFTPRYLITDQMSQVVFAGLILLCAIIPLFGCFAGFHLKRKVDGALLIDLYLSKLSIRRLFTNLFRSDYYGEILEFGPLVLTYAVFSFSIELLSLRGDEYDGLFWTLITNAHGYLLAVILVIRFGVDFQCNTIVGWHFGLKARIFPYGCLSALRRCVMEIPASLALYFLLKYVFFDSYIFHAVLLFITIAAWLMLVFKLRQYSENYRHIIKPLRRRIQKLAIFAIIISVLLLILPTGSINLLDMNLLMFVAIGPVWAAKIWIVLKLNMELLEGWHDVGRHRLEGSRA